jgi:hypothetical protein
MTLDTFRPLEENPLVFIRQAQTFQANQLNKIYACILCCASSYIFLSKYVNRKENQAGREKNERRALFGRRGRVSTRLKSAPWVRADPTVDGFLIIFGFPS